MSVIAFRPRPQTHPESRVGSRTRPGGSATALSGTFRSPRGRSGTMSGSLRLQRLVLVPRGAFVTGVFTGELRESDGSLIGVDSRRATAQVDLIRDKDGLRPVVRPLQLDLMGITVAIEEFVIEPALAFPRGGRLPERAATRRHVDVSREDRR